MKLRMTTIYSIILFGTALVLLASHQADASFCGRGGVPYSFEVLPSGAPVLGCAQPSCVAVPGADSPGDTTADVPQEDSEFLTDVNGQPDGFFRDGDRTAKRYRHRDAPKFIANCSGGFNELSCPKKNQWVGGIEYIDHPRQPVILQCCTFSGLRFSQEVGSTTVGPGEAITGGEVIRNSRQISFDLIANVKKVVKDGKTGYEVTVRRMNCLPDPPEPEIQFEDDVPSEVYKILSSAANKDLGTAQKFEKKESPLKAEKKTKDVVYGTHSATIGEAQPQLNVNSASAQPFQPPPIQTATAQSSLNGQATAQPVNSQPGQNVFSGFHTLPPHTFPTLPTLPPHTFPTFPPHTFPPHTLPPGFPTFGTPAGQLTFGFGDMQAQPHQPQAPAQAFAASSVTTESSPLAPLPSIGDANSVAVAINERSQSLSEQQQQLPRGVPEQLTLPTLIQPPLQSPQNLQAPAGAGGAFGSAAVTPPTLPTLFPTLPTLPTLMPPAPPAMGSILTQLTGNVHPIMLPGLGIVGYSNNPQPNN